MLDAHLRDGWNAAIIESANKLEDISTYQEDDPFETAKNTVLSLLSK